MCTAGDLHVHLVRRGADVLGEAASCVGEAASSITLACGWSKALRDMTPGLRKRLNNPHFIFEKYDSRSKQISKVIDLLSERPVQISNDGNPFSVVIYIATSPSQFKNSYVIWTHLWLRKHLFL
jgi:hypothetical protein